MAPVTRNSVSADEMAEILDHKLQPLKQQIQEVSNKLDSFTKEDVEALIDVATEGLRTIVSHLTDKCDNLAQENKRLCEALKQQQSYIERLDIKE